MTKRDETSEAPSEAAPPDLALVTGPTDDAKGAKIVRFREGRVEAGEVRPSVDGVPLAEHAELVRLKPRASGDVPLFEVESLYKREDKSAAPARKGPAQVATTAYRANWDTVFAALPEPSTTKGALN